MSSVVRKISLASAMLGAAVLASVILGPAGAANAQDVTSPDAMATADSSADISVADALPINIAGQWGGVMTDDKLGAGNDFSINFHQTSKKLSIGWSVDFASASFQGAGTGKSNSKKVKFDLMSGSFNKKNCQAKFTSVFASGGHIQGNYKWSGCGEQFKGDKGGTIDIFVAP